MQSSLDPQKKTILQLADRGELANALTRLQVSTDASWLSSTNPYYENAQDRIKSDSKTVPPTQKDAFADYLAASSFVHCGDAWGYLGRAVDSLVRGDLHTAVHLTYYAELRGAISLLASEGIYVGNGYNSVVTAGGEVRNVSNEGTHAAVWKLLEAWSEFSQSRSLIGQVLRPGGAELNAWVSSLPGASIGPIISDLFSNIAFDLQSFSTDRERRNTSSYDPSRLKVNDLATTDMCRMVSHLWTSLEPDVRGGFPVLDNLLLRNILHDIYSSVNAIQDENGEPTGKIDWSKWDQWVDAIIPAQNVSTALHDQIKADPTDAQLDKILAPAFANNTSAKNPNQYIESMLTRTIVLLRLSTGTCIRLLEDSGIDFDDIRPWVDSLGLARGLWAISDPPEDSIDLWADAEVAKDSLEVVAGLEPYEAIDLLSAQAIVLGQTERVVAWSFS